MEVFAEILPSNTLTTYSHHILWILVIFIIGCLFVVQKLFPPKKSVKNKLALVTGAGNGLGASIAFQLAKEGCNIAVIDINFEAAQKSVREIRKLGVKAEAYKVDVSNLNEIEEVKRKIEQDLGKVDILINNAAMLFVRCIESEKPELIQKMINVNVMSVIWTTRVFLKTMIEQNYGHIVTISSMAALTATPVGLTYTTTKFAVRGFMESLALDLSHRGLSKKIKVTTVYPPFMSTNSEVVKVFEEGAGQRPIIPLYTPESVAETIVDGIRNEKETLVIPHIIHYITYAM